MITDKPDDLQELKPAPALASAQGHVESVSPLQSDLTNSSADESAPSDGSTLGIADTRSTRARRWSPLETICVKNFKATKEASIPLRDVTILVGPNGCGKSSVLQAIHWAARSASYVLPKNTKEMISFERLDYVPSSDPLTTLHNGEMKSDGSSTPVEVIFTHRPIAEEVTQATVRIRAARNRGGITAYMDGGSAVTPYKQRYQFITAYIPGLAGLAEKESILAQPTLRRQAASGDAGGVLRNILLNLRSRRVNETDDTQGKERLRRLNELIRQVHPGVEINVSFDEREDYHITASISTISQSRPLETAATGVLQVVQIFAYLILFEPKVMLIDEPDAHLHPDKQERLIEALERAAPEFETQIILTTHSPHIVRAASPSARLVWMRNGIIETDDDDAIRRLLGWGGLDKAALFFIEDEDDKPLRAILRQWPELFRQISLCRCFGIDNLPRDKFLRGLLVDGELKVDAFLHRDRDFMTAEETEKWCRSFKTDRVFPWVTRGCDVEAYFCESEYLVALFSVTFDEANHWRNAAAQSVTKARETFLEKRKAVVRTLWPNGGSPNSETMWEEAGGKTPATVKGKALLAALKVEVKNSKKDPKLLDGFTIPSNFEVASDLKNLIKAILEPVATIKAPSGF
ncbi:ATP-dependent nuclease [Rhodopseudomonas pseudopalustris]|uniref:ATPase/GTPase, AAA15 family n=1 Tax=Rhodopseudomonas pseudopalustris TaxID=1513892 RepID=A0A1H8TDC7_9BRAD|nr:AAA family ATPase [Rhodopseudomonas pseudopalustris]SEO89110.1 ATPase/GTPase, AAA15 family [Rhodopseudomonas pseudopalustris]